MSRLGNTAGPPRHLPPASAWSPGLAFISLLWANATAFVLIGRSPLGGVFRFGFHDIVAGYDVYAGDILFTMLILLPFGALSLGGRRLARAHTALAAVLPLGVLACFAAALASAGGMRNLSPAFAEGGASFPPRSHRRTTARMGAGFIVRVRFRLSEKPPRRRRERRAGGNRRAGFHR